MQTEMFLWISPRSIWSDKRSLPCPCTDLILSTSSSSKLDEELVADLVGVEHALEDVRNSQTIPDLGQGAEEFPPIQGTVVIELNCVHAYLSLEAWDVGACGDCSIRMITVIFVVLLLLLLYLLRIQVVLPHY